MKGFFCLLIGVVLGASVLINAAAQAQDAVGVITEIKLNRGDVQIRLPGKNWQKPALLQSLYIGTQIQASRDAKAVVLYTEGMKTVTVDERNSPLEIKAADAKGAAGGGMREVANTLMGKKKPPSYVPLAVRGGKRPPVLLSPRNTKLMTDSPTLQWMGMERQPGNVRLYGPDGVLWSAENISLTQIKYPASAPRLKPGVEYAWVIEKKGSPAEKVRFQLLAPAEAKAVEGELASVQNNPGVPRTTAAILKAGLLTSRELYYDAREVLAEAVKADPDEPTLHFLLAEVYEKTGLKDMAAEEYSESDFLLKQKQ
ncbi:MAG: tetratricopeptide repeat protein [Candidatus Binatia bacterium]